MRILTSHNSFLLIFCKQKVKNMYNKEISCNLFVYCNLCDFIDSFIMLKKTYVR
jgi:hypothetical protein